MYCNPCSVVKQICIACDQFVETWLTEHCTAVDVPGYSCHSVCRPVAQRGPTGGGICLYVAERLSQLTNVCQSVESRSRYQLCVVAPATCESEWM